MASNSTSIITASCADDYDPNSMSVTKAKAFITKFLTPVDGVLRVPIRDSLDHVLAEDIISPVDVPPYRNSAMDGWAFRFSDLTNGDTVLTEVGTAFAGIPYKQTLQAGQCVRIMTGGVVPEGTDTVVMQERVRSDGKKISIAAGQQPGQNIRMPGEDLKKGQVALHRGKLMRPADLGLIASLGIGEVSIYRRLRVAFFSTGDELKSIGTSLNEGEIYDSNRYTIYGLLTRLGCEVLDMGVIRDDPAEIENAFTKASQIADAVITSGGVSVGEADFVKDILNKLGEVVFWKIAMKPGRPLAYGKIGKAHFFGLPGNPVSVMMTFYQFVREALLTLMGVTPLPSVPMFKVKCLSPIKKIPGRTEFQRAILSQHNNEWVVNLTGAQGSGILKSMSEANCFIVLNEATGNVEAGALVDVQLMEGMV